MTTRQRFLTTAMILTGATVLESCSSGPSAYDRAITRTWTPAGSVRSQGGSLQRELVRFAILAPSSHNTQCWKFTIEGNRISVLPDFARRCPAVDPDDHHLFVSLGCATENLVQAGRARGVHADVRFDPTGDGAVRIVLAAAKPIASPLFDAITMRQCSRNEYDGRPVPIAQLQALERAGQGDGVTMHLTTARPQMEHILEYVVRGNTLQISDASFMAELRNWIRFDDAQAVATSDGLFSRASGSPAVPPWLGKTFFRLLFTAKSENEKYVKFVRSSAGIAVFASAVSDKKHWVEAGRCYERFVLQAAAMGIQTAMMNQPVEVSTVRPDFAKMLGLGGGSRPDLVVRFGYGPQMPRSLRRSVDAVLA